MVDSSGELIMHVANTDAKESIELAEVVSPLLESSDDSVASLS